MAHPLIEKLVKKPQGAPKLCGDPNQFQHCRGCGVETNLVKPGHCHVVEGDKALKPPLPKGKTTS